MGLREDLGLVSYWLVIYCQCVCVKCYGAGILNALLNRVGDLALLMVTAGMLSFGG